MTQTTSNSITGYLCGIISGVSYGLNPLFAKPLLESGMPLMVLLFFRYGLSVIFLGLWILYRRESLRVTCHEFVVLFALGLLFSASSLFLFASYRFIPSGLATTLVYLYPVLVAIIMVFLRFYPSLRTWISIFATFVGVVLLVQPSGGETIRPVGLLMALVSATSYALYLVIVNRSKRIKRIPERVLTLYVLIIGTVVFLSIRLIHGGPVFESAFTFSHFANLLGLAIAPTMISITTLAIATRKIGPTKTSIMGVFEPLTAILIGVLAFGEPFTPLMSVGITICLLAVLFIIKPRRS